MPWYVLYTKPRQEKKVADSLDAIGIEAYCPLVTIVKQWSDRKKKVQIPLINSYVFVNIEEHQREEVFKVSGIVRYLFWLGKPAVVRAIEIEALKQSLEGIVASFEVSAIQKDTIYKIPEGPFQGFEGIVKNINATTIQLLLVDLGFFITLTRK
jgi:transcription antitermination factor NusG